ncbi:MAG: hypothetical protein Tsb0013_08120 [Phycisphaerales bacterium]
MFDGIAPGDTIRCTVTKEPKREDARQTVARLMRFDPEIKRALKSAQEHRMRTLWVRSRGKRPWAVRRKAARHAIPSEGATWTMPFVAHVMNDFQAVSDFVKVEKA